MNHVWVNLFVVVFLASSFLVLDEVWKCDTCSNQHFKLNFYFVLAHKQETQWRPIFNSIITIEYWTIFYISSLKSTKTDQFNDKVIAWRLPDFYCTCVMFTVFGTSMSYALREESGFKKQWHHMIYLCTQGDWFYWFYWGSDLLSQTLGSQVKIDGNLYLSRW